MPAAPTVVDVCVGLHTSQLCLQDVRYRDVVVDHHYIRIVLLVSCHNRMPPMNLRLSSTAVQSK